MKTASHTINGIERIFEVTQIAAGENTKADLIKRGFDGTIWAGVAKQEGRMKERIAMFYRTPQQTFQFVTLA